MDHRTLADGSADSGQGSLETPADLASIGVLMNGNTDLETELVSMRAEAASVSLSPLALPTKWLSEPLCLHLHPPVFLKKALLFCCLQLRARHSEMKKSLLTEELVVLQEEATTLHYSHNQEVKLNAEALQQASATVQSTLCRCHILFPPFVSRAHCSRGAPRLTSWQVKSLQMSLQQSREASVEQAVLAETAQVRCRRVQACVFAAARRVLHKDQFHDVSCAASVLL
jgi:hypothetical protein